MVLLTCVAEGSMLAVESPCPEKLVLEAWGLVRCILKKFLLLRPRGKVVESYGALGSFPRWCFLQRQHVAHFN